MERAVFDAHMQAKALSEDPLFFAIVDPQTNLAVGRATLMRIDPPNRVIEIGGIIYTRALGFSFEGIFRQHMIIKGMNRDTAWFSMLDSEWPARKREFERWLDESNFDSAGNQKTALKQNG
jgi:RimJ/RimL family protein N-acetyltransferase